MLFRFKGVVPGMGLDKDGISPIVLSTTGEQSLRVELRDESESGLELQCEVIAERKPPPKVLRCFEDLAAARLPSGSPGPQGRRTPIADSSGQLLVPLQRIPMHCMPPRLSDYAATIQAELSDAANRALGLLRWRSAELGRRRPISGGVHEWSLGNGEWHPFPSGETGARILPSAYLELSREASEDLQHLFAGEESEPFAYELLREAWELRESHPRSALLIAVAALEVGVKHYIAKRDPGSEWLSDESPPVVDLLRDYVPNLDPPNGSSPAASRASVPRGEVLKELEKRVFERNRIVHDPAAHTSRKPIVTPDRARSAVLAAREVLMGLDAADGQLWAEGYVEKSLKDEPSSGYRAVD